MKQFMLRRLGVAHDAGSAKPSLQDCLEAILEQSDGLIDDVLEGLRASVLGVQGKTLHALQNPSGKAAIEQLCARGDLVRQSFAHALRVAMYGGNALRHSVQPLVRFDDFQFLEEDQIDANIEMAMTQQEVMLAVDQVLPPLNSLVSSLMGWSTAQPHLNPIKPDSFVYALRESFAGQGIPDAVRSGLMTAAAGLLGVSLRHLYKEVIAWLRTQGVEPVATAGRVEGDAGAHGQPAQNPVTRTLLTLDKLRKLLSGELDPRPLTGGIKDFTNTVPASYDALEDLKLIEPMMKRLAERAAQTQAARQVTAGGLQGTDAAAQHKLSLSKKLGQQLGEEVVRMMLDNLMQDQRLLADVRQSLKAMEPILIRLSQADPRFFSDRQHPARLFLDKITNRSLAFSSDQEPGFARFYKALQNSVSVLAGGVGDAAAFARLLRKLEDAWAAEEHDQRARAEEAARGLLHAEQRNLLAQRLAQEFAEKMQGKSVPEIVQNFLSGPWAQVVAQAQLDRADGSADAEGYRGLVDDLIWSVQMRLVRRNRARLVEIVPGMLVRMRQGLALISYPPERMALFFDQLISLHEQAFEAGRTTEDAPTPPGGVKAPVAADTFWLGASEAADSGFLDEAAPLGAPGLAGPKQPEPDQPQTWTPDNLASGSWVDLALGREWVRAQLTWASPQRTLFMFISGKGLAHSMSRRTMDRLRGLGLIRLVSDGRVIDNALDAVAQAALRNDLDKTIGSG